MFEAFLPWFLGTILCIAVSFVVSGYRLFDIGRRCRRLELRLIDLEENAASVRGKVAAARRWKQDDWIKELEQANNEKPLKAAKYANDPIGE